MKEPLASTTVQMLIEALTHAAKTTDKIAAILALRDILMLHLGFFGLLRQSEIVNIKTRHFRYREEGHAADSLTVPRSKTDQAGMGERIPLTRKLPNGEDIKTILDTLKDKYRSLGWDTHNITIMPTYDARRKCMTQTPIAKSTVSSRLKHLLRTHLNLPDKVIINIASHSMRRGGATYYAAIGVPGNTIQKLGRWKSHAFELYTEQALSITNDSLALLMKNN